MVGKQPNDTELNDFNELIGDFLSSILDHMEIPHHLIFNCNLAKNRESIHNPRKSFGVSQVTKIEGDGIFNITTLAELFTDVAREVIVGIEKVRVLKGFDWL
ncbi:unnamed protein product [Cylicocyclus nassatus]|uniref:Uncharacterized protein n=1 Tax=Cylicocyclus nassatus TaxID=53992 RepID=A0AA36M6J9_CYLNA|nr:unnamed protein product [Cylicocyclus nassatus]